MSELTADYAAAFRTASDDFAYGDANAVLAELGVKCRAFLDGPGAGSINEAVEYFAEARYPHQIWELEVPLRVERFQSEADVEQLREDFHTVHEEVFAISDTESPIEVVAWRARVRCRLREPGAVVVSASAATPRHGDGSRRAYFAETGLVDARVRLFEAMGSREVLAGPAIVESPVTTVVIDPGATAERTTSGSLLVSPWGARRKQVQTAVRESRA
jgi:N-methylhydantoinase A